MIRFNRRSWLLSIRADELSDMDPALLPSALALQAAVIADGLTDQPAWVVDDGAGPRSAHRRAARLSRPDLRRASPRRTRPCPSDILSNSVRRLSAG